MTNEPPACYLCGMEGCQLDLVAITEGVYRQMCIGCQVFVYLTPSKPKGKRLHRLPEASDLQYNGGYFYGGEW